MTNKKEFLIQNLKCDCNIDKKLEIIKCKKCNLRLIDNILCFENFEKKDLIVEDFTLKKRYSSWKKYNFEKVNLALKDKKNLKILDIGSGRHFIEKLYPHLNKNTFFRLDIGKRNYVDIIADFQKNSYFNSCFDVIICLNVMEHVYNFDKFFKNIAKVVKKRGLVLMSVPYSSGLHYLPHDYFRMSHYALKIMFEENQFHINQIEPYYQNVVNKLLKLVDICFLNNNKLSKLIRKLIIFLIRLQNKIYTRRLERKLIDEVDIKNKKLYAEPLGYFITATKL
jgi:SAM-dependent methyltransferase